MADLIGQTLGNYRIESLLGSGGMGQVYLGVHVHLQRTVAVKVLRQQFDTDPSFRARFLQEARAAAALSHPNIVHVYDFGEAEDRCYLVMELVGEGSIRSLQPHEPDGSRRLLPLALAIKLIRQTAEGLDYAHRHGMVHRDIKPDNLMLARIPETAPEEIAYQVKITDFGLARLAEGGVSTATGMTMGTPSYMSPEQCQGLDLDGRSDIYSLGVVLYEVATGYVPFQIKGLSDAVYKHIYTPPPPPREMRADLPADLEAIILKCLAKSPSERYATADELALALGALTPETRAAEQASDIASPATSPDADTVPRGAALSVELAQDSLAITPGQLAITNVTVRNTGSSHERIRLTVDGVPNEWISTPPGELRLAPHSQASIALPVLVPSAASEPGDYRVTVRAAADDDPGVAAIAEASWTVMPTGRTTTGATPAHNQAAAAAMPPTRRRVPAWLATLAAVAAIVAVGGLALALTRDGGGSDDDSNQALFGSPTATDTTAADATTTDPATSDSSGAALPTDTPVDATAVSDATSTEGSPIDTPTVAEQPPVVTNTPTVEPFDMAFATGRGNGEPNGSLDIYVMRSDGSGQRPLIADDGDDWSPAWSPNGQQIAWISKRDGNDEIYVANADGSNQLRLTNFAGDDRFPEWSPDGEHLAFVRNIEGNEELFAIHADGSNEVQLTNTPGYDGFHAWSPDGSWIAFTSNADGDNEIMVVSVDGAERRQLTDDDDDDFNPVWSPDGAYIAFVTDRDGNNEIYFMRADGSEQRNLTFSDEDEINPVFAPHGNVIAFVREEAGGNALKWLDLDSGDIFGLTGGLADDADLQWSPDGQWIAFLRAGDTYIDIYVVDPSGAGREQMLTTNPTFDGGVDWYPAPTQP